MKKYAAVFTGVVLFIFVCIVSAFASDISWHPIGKENLNLKTVSVNPINNRIIYIGSSNGLFKSDDGGGSWRNILYVKGENKSINFLLFEPGNTNSIYAATGNGLFYSPNTDKSWSRVFRGKNSWENDCTTLAILPYRIYLGTRGGLFTSKDKGRSWHKEATKLGNAHILAITYNVKEPNSIYVASTDGVYKTQNAGNSWERVFVAHQKESNHDKEEDIEDNAEERSFSDISYISCDTKNLNFIYLATSGGVYKSTNKGLTWNLLSDFGLLNKDVKFLLISSDSVLYAATKSGVFVFRNERWYELSFTLPMQKVNFLTLDKLGNLYAASDKGLFRTNVASFNAKKLENVTTLYYKGEPKIKDVQEAAIRYAEVESEKIKKWRKSAAKKAILPTVSVGVDRNTSDLWHWETGSSSKSEDDVLRRGNDAIGWDVRLSWDLSELIWNPDQTSIDVRSRLLVELRDDILDEVTKLYFERLRVKRELDNLSIEDRDKRFEKELKLEELAASLDALTGGYFSQQLNSNKFRS